MKKARKYDILKELMTVFKRRGILMKGSALKRLTACAASKQYRNTGSKEVTVHCAGLEAKTGEGLVNCGKRDRQQTR